MLQNRFAATAAKECLVSYKNVSRTQPARLHLRDKAIRLRERPHQKPSIIRSPPGCLKPACVQIRGKAAAERVNLLRRSCGARAKPGTAREPDKPDSRTQSSPCG